MFSKFRKYENILKIHIHKYTYKRKPIQINKNIGLIVFYQSQAICKSHIF